MQWCVNLKLINSTCSKKQLNSEISGLHMPGWHIKKMELKFKAVILRQKNYTVFLWHLLGPGWGTDQWVVFLPGAVEVVLLDIRLVDCVLPLDAARLSQSVQLGPLGVLLMWPHKVKVRLWLDGEVVRVLWTGLVSLKEERYTGHSAMFVTMPEVNGNF